MQEDMIMLMDILGGFFEMIFGIVEMALELAFGILDAVLGILGGVASLIFSVFGVVLVIALVAVFVSRRKKKQQPQKNGVLVDENGETFTSFYHQNQE